MLIRAATEADLDHLVRLNDQVQAQHARAHPSQFKFPTDPGRVGKFFRRLLLKPALYGVIVAEGAGGVVGYLWFEKQNKPGSVFSHGKKRLLVHHVCVDEAHRRHGIARNLFGFVDGFAEAEGFDEVVLDTWADNAAARACFTALGFQPCRVTFWNRREGA